jgi:hypothetical protein
MLGSERGSMFKLLRSLFRPQVGEVSYRHDELGLLRLDGSLWSGAVARDALEIKLFVGGTTRGPDDRLLASLQDVIKDFAERERIARVFIASHDSLIDANSFRFCSINVFWPKRPECYYFEYEMVGDEQAIWRVEFEGVAPKYLGRDD